MGTIMRRILLKIGVIFYLLCGLSLCVFARETVSVYTQNNAPREAFILFYLSSCPHCQRFDPVLREYAEQHHIPVLAYTLDGKSLPSFPRSVLPTPAEKHRFFPNGNAVVPTLFLMNFDQHKIMPVLQGEANPNQLARRMKRLRAMEGGGDNEDE